MTEDELVEMVEAAISRQMMRTVLYARGDRMFSHVARAAIAVALEAAAKVADEEACYCEDTGSAPSDFGNAGRNDAARTIAAAIRALKGNGND